MKPSDYISPAPLRKGDRIGICAPARKVTPAEMEPAIQRIREEGFEPVISPNLYKEHHQFSGTDEQRVADLQQFLDDDTVKAVISARGGYGTLRIIDKLDWKKFDKGPKWICGYSDITVLHSRLHQKGFASLHCTMPINFGKDEDSTTGLFKALRGEELSYDCSSHELNRTGKVSAMIAGGNLSLIYAQLGSSSDLNTEGKILFLEDLDEYLYHIDRMILSLKRAGKFDKLAGLIIGGMSDMKDNAVPYGKTALEIIEEHTREYAYPVCYGFPAGHEIKNYALPFGMKAELDVDSEKCTLHISGNPLS